MNGAMEAANADELVAAAVGQLDAGADLVKLYMDGPDVNVSPWTANEVARVTEAAHGRGARVAAHSGRLNGAREAVLGGVDSIEHGFDLDAAVAAEMAARGTTLVSTLAVMRSWLSFGDTTTMERFAGEGGRATIQARLEQGEASVRTARDAGVAIATGSDFGGGSLRANQLAWEVTSLVAAGLEPVQALAAATWRGGELLGEEEAGVIREGGPADFFLVHGDPLSDPEALWRVWRTAYPFARSVGCAVVRWHWRCRWNDRTAHRRRTAQSRCRYLALRHPSRPVSVRRIALTAPGGAR